MKNTSKSMKGVVYLKRLQGTIPVKAGEKANEKTKKHATGKPSPKTW